MYCAELEYSRESRFQGLSAPPSLIAVNKRPFFISQSHIVNKQRNR